MSFHFRTLHERSFAKGQKMSEADFLVTFVTFVKTANNLLRMNRQRMLHFIFFKFKNVTIVTGFRLADLQTLASKSLEFCNRFCNTFCNMISPCDSRLCFKCYKNNKKNAVCFENGAALTGTLKTLQGYGC
jgi:hypothetical protein